MSCRSFRHIIALLDHDERGMWSVLDRAVELAEAERARLTLAKTTDPGPLVRWFAPLAMLSRVAPVNEPDIQTMAANQLARAAEFVPACVRLTTILLGPDTIRALHQLAASGAYDLIVMRDGAHSRRLRRELRRLELCTLAVVPEPSSEAGLLTRGAPGALVR